MKLPGKHGGGEVNDVCFISPLAPKTSQTFKANQGISKQIIVFQAVLGLRLRVIINMHMTTLHKLKDEKMIGTV